MLLNDNQVPLSYGAGLLQARPFRWRAVRKFFISYSTAFSLGKCFFYKQKLFYYVCVNKLLKLFIVSRFTNT